MRLANQYSTIGNAIHVDNGYAYVMTNTFDTTRIAITIGKLYKINLDNSLIEDSIIINTNPIEFEANSTKFFVSNDTLNYFARGNERRDTIINGQNVFTYYHHFKLNLNDGTWSNQTFPAFDATGLQFLVQRDAAFSSSSVYSANFALDTTNNETDVLVTRLDHNGNVIWNKNYANETSQSIWSILEDQDGNIVFCGNFFSLSRDRRTGFSHLYIQKIKREDGSIIKIFSVEEDTGSPRASVEDPNGGYIISSGDAEFREGGSFPAITRIIKIDKNLDSIVWELPLSDTLTFNTFWHLDKFISLGNNEFLGVGVAESVVPFSHLGRVVKFTGDGELLFDKEIYNLEFTRGLEQRLVDVVPYKEGFLACGTLLGSLDILSPRQQGWVVYFDNDGNSDFSSSILNLGITDTNSLKVYPNPSEGQFTIEFNEKTESRSRYTIYTIDGRKVKNGSMPSGTLEFQLEMFNFQSGNYILEVVNTEFKKSLLLYRQ